MRRILVFLQNFGLSPNLAMKTVNELFNMNIENYVMVNFFGFQKIAQALGGITLEVVHLPGHTAGSIGLWSPERKLLWVGDAMNCFVWLFLPEARSLDTYINTLHKAAKLPFTHMIQSHEPDPVPKRRLWDYLDLAEHLDFEQGTLVPAPLGYQGETRICTKNGIHYDDRDHPGFAAMMISREKIGILEEHCHER